MSTATRYPRPWRAALAAGLAVLCLAASSVAPAALFDDDEARRAILDLRQRVEAQRQAARAPGRGAATRHRGQRASCGAACSTCRTRSRRCAATSRSCAARTSSWRATSPTCSARQKDIAQGVDERLRKVEPSKVTVDDHEFIADPDENARLRRGARRSSARGEFPAAQTAFADFLKRYPQSGFIAHGAVLARQCAVRQARLQGGAIATFRALLAAGAGPSARARGGAVDRQLPDRAEGQRRRAPHARRADQDLSAVRGRAGRPRSGWRACADAALARAVTRLDDDAPTSSAASAAWSASTATPARRAIRAAHVAVVGIGGVGSWAAEALARSGVGALTLIDLDHVAESNVNRQVQALGGTLGQAKVEAMARAHRPHPSGLQGARHRGVRRAGQLAAAAAGRRRRR